MSGLFLPDSAFRAPELNREQKDQRVRRETIALNAMLEEGPAVKEFNRDLEKAYPGMRLFFCPDPAPIELVSLGAQPGCWGLLLPPRRGGPLSVLPLTGDTGEYREPGGWVFDMLPRQDLWNGEVKRERERAHRELAEAKRRREAEERAERDEDVLERYLAANRAFVSMDRSQPWSQNVKGRRGAKKD